MIRLSILPCLLTTSMSCFLLLLQISSAFFLTGLPTDLYQESRKARLPSSLPSPSIPSGRSSWILVAAASTEVDANVNVDIDNWTPRSKYWYDSDAMDGVSPSTLALQMGIDLNHVGESKDTAAAVIITSSNNNKPTIKKLYKNEMDVVVAVEIETAITEHEALQIQSLAQSIRNHDLFSSTLFEHRSFGPEKGGNDCTYLAPLLQTLLPDTMKTILSITQLAFEHANWNDLNLVYENCDHDVLYEEGNEDEEVEYVYLEEGEEYEGVEGEDYEIEYIYEEEGEEEEEEEEDDEYDDHLMFPSPTKLGIRTSEHLTYNGWKSLEPHRDIGSIYTCNIALQEPTSYNGGEFFFHTSYDNDVTEIKLQRLSAIVFLSDVLHGVRPIVSGGTRIRESFVTEFWKNDDSPLGMNRPTNESWEEFVSRLQEEEEEVSD